jgi:hypothetical protein
MAARGHRRDSPETMTRALLLATFAVLCTTVAACGCSSDESSAGTEGGTATVLIGTAPDYPDPQEGSGR